MEGKLNKEIDALINLLDDPDEGIYHTVRDKLIHIGEPVIPFLENAWEHESFGVLFQNRIEDIIHTIQFEQVCHLLKQWKASGSDDLLEGALIINQYQYPDFDRETVLSKVEKVRQEIWLELNENLTAYEKVRVINHLLFEVHGFSGNTTNYHAPQNSYISEVIETGKGNPLSLCILYIAIAQKLDLPVFGVNLPRHFILCYQDKLGIFSDVDNKNNILFYINPFSKGTVLSKREIDDFLKQLKTEPEDTYYKACSNLEIIIRVLNNLIYSYDKLGYKDKMDELLKLKKVLDP